MPLIDESHDNLESGAGLADLSVPRRKIHLVKDTNKYFSCLFGPDIDDDFNFLSVHGPICYSKKKDSFRVYNDGEKLALFDALGCFLDKTSKMTYTAVEKTYGRRRDELDIARNGIDEDDNGFPVDHYALAESGIGATARLHGFMRDGVFVVSRIDWGHTFHLARKTQTDSVTSSDTSA